MEQFIGEIRMVAFNYAPVGWALCNGQLLSIAQNSALFALVGTMYGGDGQTTFALPDLRGRVPIHFGTGPGLSARTQGQRSGAEAHTLLATEMPAHTHPVTATLNGTSATANAGSPGGAALATSSSLSLYAGSGINPPLNRPLAAGTVGVTANMAGGSQPHNNMQPYLVINFIIALEGLWPSRP